MQNLKQTVLQALSEIKAREVNSLDVQDLTQITDHMIIATGTSATHVRAIAESVIQKAREQQQKPYGVEGEKDAEWILIDFGDVVVHIMLSAVREFYSLEKFWTKIGTMSKEPEPAVA